jgi:hypothetical protein
MQLICKILSVLGARYPASLNGGATPVSCSLASNLTYGKGPDGNPTTRFCVYQCTGGTSGDEAQLRWYTDVTIPANMPCPSDPNAPTPPPPPTIGPGPSNPNPPFPKPTNPPVSF